MEYIITVPVQHAHATQSHRDRRASLRLVQGGRGEDRNGRPGAHWRAGAIITLKISTTLVMIAGIAACGGGGSAASTPAAFDGTSLRSVLFDAYGDSTMEGLTKDANGNYVMTPNNQPMYLQKLLQAQFGTQVKGWNQGVSGTTLQQLIDGTDGRHTMNLQTLMQKSAAQIVIENFGDNDAEAQSLAQYMSNIDYFVTQARANGKFPVLEEPNPVCNPSPAPKNIHELDAEVAALEEYAARYNVMLVKQYDYIKNLPDWQSMLSDCIHPTPQLYEIEAQRIAVMIAPIVRSMTN